jgi:hypothetical protein
MFKLLNGSWLMLSTVRAIRVAEYIPADPKLMRDYTIKDRVIVEYEIGGHDNCEIVYFDSPAETQQYADKLADEAIKFNNKKNK